MTNINTLRQIADQNILYGLFCEELGLYNGKTGMSLFFLFLSRYTANHWYEEFAGELLDDVCNGLLSQYPATFADGICGIGWSIEFMKKQGFINEDTDEILDEIDQQVMERNVCRMQDYSLKTGLEGIVAYVQSRLNSERKSTNFRPFDKVYLESLDMACQKANILWRSEKYGMQSVWNRVIHEFSLLKGMKWQNGLVILNEIK